MGGATRHYFTDWLHEPWDPSIKPASLNPKTASCTLFYELHLFGPFYAPMKVKKISRNVFSLFDTISHCIGPTSVSCIMASYASLFVCPSALCQRTAAGTVELKVTRENSYLRNHQGLIPDGEPTSSCFIFFFFFFFFFLCSFVIFHFVMIFLQCWRKLSKTVCYLTFLIVIKCDERQ